MAEKTLTPMVWAKNRQPGDGPTCAACGRRLGKRYLIIEVIDGGAHVAPRGSACDENDPGYMGYFPVGHDCARKYFPDCWMDDGP